MGAVAVLLGAGRVVAAVTDGDAGTASGAVGAAAQGDDRAAADPVLAAVRLTRVRAGALTAGDAQLLAGVTVPGSPAAHADTRTLLGLAVRDALAGQVRVQVEEASRTPARPGYRCPACVRVLLAARVTAGESFAEPARRVVVVLQPTRTGWRVSEVESSR